MMEFEGYLDALRKQDPQLQKYLRSFRFNALACAKSLRVGEKCEICDEVREDARAVHIDYQSLYREEMSDLLYLCPDCRVRWEQKLEGLPRKECEREVG